MFVSFESSNARKISLEEGGGGENQDPGDPGMGKVRGGKDFFPSSRGGTDPGWHYDCTPIDSAAFYDQPFMIYGSFSRINCAVFG